MLIPADDKQLAEAVATATAPLSLEGHGSKRGLGRPMQTAATLSLSAFTGVTFYEPAELVIEAGAATPLEDIERMLDAHGQRLAFEPPDYSALLGTARGSIGGALACNLSGPRRLIAGAARDHILGVKGVSGRGEIFKAGGRVVKNVTGYDISKLMAGSYGTLAALTSVTFKVQPKAESETTLVCKVRDIHHAGEIMRAAMQSPHDVSSAAYDPTHGALLRFEGIAASVADRSASLIRHLGLSLDLISENDSHQLWRGVRDGISVTGDCIWRISTAPSDGPALAERLRNRFSASLALDWSGGLIWCGMAKEAARELRAMMPAGHATLMRAPDDVRLDIEVFQPQEPGLAKLTARVKQAFDPRCLFNPGRMYKGV